MIWPGAGFAPEHAELRKRWHMPCARTFATQPQLGLALIRPARTNGLEFAGVGMDSVDGCAGQMRADLDAQPCGSRAGIPADPQVYLHPPGVGIPETPAGQPGRPFVRPPVLQSKDAAIARRSLCLLRLRSASLRLSSLGSHIWHFA